MSYFAVFPDIQSTGIIVDKSVSLILLQEGSFGAIRPEIRLTSTRTRKDQKQVPSPQVRCTSDLAKYQEKSFFFKNFENFWNFTILPLAGDKKNKEINSFAGVEASLYACTCGSFVVHCATSLRWKR